MEKVMLAIGKFKEGEGHFEKFMGFMQSEEGMAERKKVAHVEKTVPGILPDKSGVMFKVHVHDEEAMRDFVSGRNPVMKPPCSTAPSSRTGGSTHCSGWRSSRRRS